MVEYLALVLALAGTRLDLAVAHPGKKSLEPRDLLLVRPALNEPVRVVSLAFARKASGRTAADVIVEIENRSDRMVRFIRYAIDPPECPRWAHPMSRLVWYGRIVRRVGRDDAPGIAPGDRTTIVISGSELEWNRRHARRTGCRHDVRTELFLDKVAFSDLTGWEGFADGPEHEMWNGRPWEPTPDADPP